MLGSFEFFSLLLLAAGCFSQQSNINGNDSRFLRNNNKERQAGQTPTALNPCSYFFGSRASLIISNFGACGGTVPFNATQSMPRIQVARANPNERYVLMMVDPDALARSCPFMAFVKHWLVSNIPGAALVRGSNNIEQEQGVVVHRPYGPPSSLGTGIHRYQFLFMAQPYNQWGTPVVDNQPQAFINFDPLKLIQDNRLRVHLGYEYSVDFGVPEDCVNNPFASFSSPQPLQ